MGIKYDEIQKQWIAWHSKRPAKNVAPISFRRKGLVSEKEARKVEKELVILIQRKIDEKKVPYWNEFLSDYIKYNRAKGYTEKTNYAVDVTLKKFTSTPWSNKLVTEISTQDIHELKNDGLAKATEGNRQFVIKLINRAFTYALECGYILKSPVPKFRYKKPDKIKSVLTYEQVRRFLNFAKDLENDWYPHWVFAIYTGMRNGELYSLTWDKVDLENNRILVDCSWNSRDGFKSTKSGDDRYVEIADSLRTLIKELKLRSAGLNFVLPRMSRWDKGEQARELRMFLQGMGLPPMRFHDLRATWATLLLSRGLEPIKVMKMGGWKDMKTMMIYVRKAGIDLKGCMDGINFHEPSNQPAKVLEFSGSSFQ